MPMSLSISVRVARPVRRASRAMRCVTMIESAWSLRLVKRAMPDITKAMLSCMTGLGRYFLLRFFTTTLAMQDLDAVRQALGVPQWNLIGASYGTRAGLEYQRLFPQAVRRNVLDGLAPPDIALPKSFSTDTQAALAVWRQRETYGTDLDFVEG